MHERLRTHAESVAFFGGGAREKAVSYLNCTCFYLMLGTAELRVWFLDIDFASLLGFDF